MKPGLGCAQPRTPRRSSKAARSGMRCRATRKLRTTVLARETPMKQCTSVGPDAMMRAVPGGGGAWRLWASALRATRS